MFFKSKLTKKKQALLGVALDSPFCFNSGQDNTFFLGCAYEIMSGTRQKPSGGHVHDCTCMCARKRACMH